LYIAQVSQLGLIVSVRQDPIAKIRQLGLIVSARNASNVKIRQLGLIVCAYGIPSPLPLTATYVANEGIRLDWGIPRSLSPYVYRGYSIYRYQLREVGNGTFKRLHVQPFVFEGLEDVTYTDKSVGTHYLDIGKLYSYYMTTAVVSNQLRLVNPHNTSGMFSLQVSVPDTSDTSTVAISYTAPAIAIQSALESCVNIGAGNVSVSGPVGGPWVIAGINSLAGIDIGIKPAWDHRSSDTRIVYRIGTIESGPSNIASATFLG
jgi:hypothetical protein